jgi:hypothetical protein
MLQRIATKLFRGEPLSLLESTVVMWIHVKGEFLDGLARERLLYAGLCDRIRRAML